jgi:hypothetical protein
LNERPFAQRFDVLAAIVIGNGQGIEQIDRRMRLGQAIIEDVNRPLEQILRLPA